MLYMLRRLKGISAGHLSVHSLSFKGGSHEVVELSKSST